MRVFLESEAAKEREAKQPPRKQLCEPGPWTNENVDSAPEELPEEENADTSIAKTPIETPMANEAFEAAGTA
jgi:hypothetical protein